MRISFARAARCARCKRSCRGQPRYAIGIHVWPWLQVRFRLCPACADDGLRLGDTCTRSEMAAWMGNG